MIVVSAIQSSGKENVVKENNKSSIFLSYIFLSAGRNDDHGRCAIPFFSSMPISKSIAARLARERAGRGKTAQSSSRWLELLGLLLGSLVVLGGVIRVYQVKQTAIANAEQRLANRELLNLNRVTKPDDLVPFLGDFSTEPERKFVAGKIFDYLTGSDAGADHRRELSNVGRLSTIRVTEEEISRDPGLVSFARRLKDLKENPILRARQLAPIPLEKLEQWLGMTESKPVTLSLLTPDQLREDLKPSFIVRRPEEFRSLFWRWIIIYFSAFYAIHLFWRLCGFKGDGLILPAVHLLTGVGLMLMVSVQDPLRDMTIFVRFASGVLPGGVALCLIACFDILPALKSAIRKVLFGSRGAPEFGGKAEEKAYLVAYLREMGYLPPLVLSFLLSILLISPLGSGPGASAAKVNLFGIQPIEIIKPLLVVFFAAYFTKHWVMIRETRQLNFAGLRVLSRIRIARAYYIMPVLLAVLVALVFFFLQRDLGPALVIAGLFLALYFVARGQMVLSVVGLLAILAGFTGGYLLKTPTTVYDRVQMYLAPWANAAQGGEQIAHAMWGLSAGGFGGTGIGLGRSGLIPEARTDLILAAIGEELGFAGLFLVFVAYAWLIYRGFRAALRASETYTFFLALGLTLLLALQLLLIAGGVMGLAPLSGVVSPFLSLGRSSMIANMAIVGLILAISARHGEPRGEPKGEPKGNADFRRPVKWIGALIGVLMICILAKAAQVQIYRAEEVLIAPALAPRSDGLLDFTYNPRILELRRLIPRGSIYDRSGLPLASSRWEEITQFRARYARLEAKIPQQPSASGRQRYYPFEEVTYHLLGDFRTERNWGATNTSFVERDSNTYLQGFDDHAEEVKVIDPRNGKTYRRLKRDYRELIPLWRHRKDLEHPEAKSLLTRSHDIRLSLDMNLQKSLADKLARRIAEAGSERGAAVVIDAATGELIASVSYPWPVSNVRLSADDDPETAEEALIDRARYALRPPGSTFKLVTAIAALRKDPALSRKTFQCRFVPERNCIGARVTGAGRPVCDDESDVISHPNGHGQVTMAEGIPASCNAYFAQLGVDAVKAEALQQTADLFGVKTSRAGTPEALRPYLSQAAYGQGEVVVSPFRLALVSATIANNGVIPSSRWMLTRDEKRDPKQILNRALAAQLAGYMRSVVTSGTGTRLNGAPVAVAGKTGTAQNNDPRAHSWFTGFAPYGETSGRRIAFAALIENGGYGGRAAASAVLDLVAEAHRLELIH